MGHQGFRPLTSRNPHHPNPSRSVSQSVSQSYVCVCTLLTRHPSLGPHPSASPHVSSRRCRCTLPSTPADLQSAGLDLLCHAPSRDKATLDSDPWLRFNRFLIRLIYGSFFSSTITGKKKIHFQEDTISLQHRTADGLRGISGPFSTFLFHAVLRLSRSSAQMYWV